jgi:hypothetical protein
MDFTEIEKLHNLLTNAGIPHTYQSLFDGKQIRIYADSEMEDELDDAVIHFGSHGVQNGLLETFCLNECEGWETAEQIFEGWLKMYQKANEKKIETCDCTIIGAGGEVWEGSAPSWD